MGASGWTDVIIRLLEASRDLLLRLLLLLLPTSVTLALEEYHSFGVVF